MTYQYTLKNELKHIDSTLTSAAYTTVSLLPKHLHKNNMTKKSLSEKKEMALVKKLDQLVDMINLEYVYTLVKQNNKFYFTSYNSTEESLQGIEEYEVRFMDHYEEAPEAIYNAYSNNEIVIAEYADKWGEFRSIFIPIIAKNGTKFVACADISLTKISKVAVQASKLAALACLLLSLVILPLFLLFLRSLTREKNILLQQQLIDRLTGLPNRNKLLEDLSTCIHPRLTILDIDKFREVANSYGPAAGDSVIRQFALRMTNFEYPKLQDLRIYRLHSDEFALLIDQPYGQCDLDMATKMFYLSLINHQYYVPGKTVNLNVRMGVALNTEDIFTLAYMALYAAKDSNETLVVYDPALKLPEMYRRNLGLLDEVKRAINEKRIVPYFQPIVNTKTNKIEKYECLARIIDSNGEIRLNPEEFLPIMQRYRLYNTFTRQIFDRILEVAIQHSDLIFTINLSMIDINNNNTKQYIISRLVKTGTAKTIEFEILEDECHVDKDKVTVFFNRLRSLGCRVGIDDLGKAHSNIDRLINLPIDFVKIDGSVVLHLSTDKDSQSLAAKAIAFAKLKRVETIAEHCSSEEIVTAVKDIGFDYMQGFHIGKPSPHINP